MTPPIPVPPDAYTTIRGLRLCFWLMVLGVVLWTVVGPLPATGVRLTPLLAVVAALPMWFLIGRLTAWVRQVGRHASEAQDVRAVARWRDALLVLSVLSAVGATMDSLSPLVSRVGLTVASLALAVCV